jgi:hypothetical protein
MVPKQPAVMAAIVFRRGVKDSAQDDGHGAARAGAMARMKVLIEQFFGLRFDSVHFLIPIHTGAPLGLE